MPAKIILSEDTITKMCQLFCEGTSIPELMKIFSLGRNKITKTLRENLKDDYTHYAQKILRLSGPKSAEKLRGKKQNWTPEWRAKIAKANRGKKRSDEFKKKISEGLKRSYAKGKRTHEKHKAAMKKAVQTKKERGYYAIHSQRHSEWMKQNAPMKGKKHSDESKQKMKESKKRFFENGGKPSQLGVKRSKEDRKRISENTKKMWREGKFGYGNNGLFRSKLEKNVFKKIQKHWRLARHSVPITINKKTYVFDIHIPELNLLIEINGDYWHMNPSIYDGDHYDESRNLTATTIWERDSRKLLSGKNAGYNVITLWEKELIDIDNSQLVLRIKSATS